MLAALRSACPVRNIPAAAAIALAHRNRTGPNHFELGSALSFPGSGIGEPWVFVERVARIFPAITAGVKWVNCDAYDHSMLVTRMTYFSK